SPAFIDAPPTLRPDWDGALLRAIDEALALEPGADPLGPCRGMLAALHDAQATVEFAEDGAWAPVRLEWVDGRALVTHADADAGLRIGDRILKVDGVEAGAWVERAMSRAPGARDDVRERVGLALGMLGPHGSTIEVRASRRGGSGEEDVRLTRRFKSTTAGDVRDVAPGVLYVDPSTFTDESFIEALRGPLSEADAVIVDYRSLGMGGLHRHLGSFIAGGAPVMTRLVPTPLYPNREEMALTNMEALLTPNHPHIAAKLIVLADAGTRSDPELDVMFVKRFKLGTIVGERTAGAAGPPAVYEFDDMGRRIVATWTAAGTTLDGTTAHFTRGVEPDVEVRPTAAGLGAGRDEALEEAIRIAKAR
ncbi:MAG: hypothetical protein IBJ10_10730, partial [Phycisphaerales bacterium]|nr:hypothetical protein [Phycisphaerales bacterium]